MRVLGIVTARGGSKAVPRKNLALLGGRPLLSYTAEAVRASRRLTRTVLSTEDEEIAFVGRTLGLDVPFMRPGELARDDTPTVPVLLDVLRRLETMGERYDAVMTLQPTSPFRTAEDIDGSIDLLEASNADSVISYVEVGGKHPARMKLINSDGRVIKPPFASQFQGHCRQGWAKFYLCEGSIYLTRGNILTELGTVEGYDCRAWLIPEERACDIDTPFDLFLAEQMLKHIRLGATPKPSVPTEVSRHDLVASTCVSL
jgi:CMP-N,N'-diacetyllegionaminic acid synthase